MTGGTDLIVVGGGIIGLAVAREAALAGLSVVLHERAAAGCEASGAAAGMLAPQAAEDDQPGPLRALCLRSRDLYPEFAAAVRSESGIDPRLRLAGTLLPAHGPAGRAALERRLAAQRAAGLEAEMVAGPALRRLEPALAAGITAALRLPRDWSVDNTLLVRGLEVAARRAGVVVECGVTVREVAVEGGRARGVVTGSGRVEADVVVVAAGAWTGEIAIPGAAAVPTEPVRGQIVCFDAGASAPVHSLVGDACYLVPRDAGLVLAGSTMERVGYDRAVTSEAVARLGAAARVLVPALASAPVRAAWAGLRPATPDGLPAIGAGAVPGLFFACGHLRDGILLAPVTARALLRMIQGEGADADLAPFSPRRFAGAPPASAGGRPTDSRPGE